ncbi:sugar transferase, partial [Tamilnaduibacter salinus]
MFKRIFDLCVGMLVLILVLPLLAVLALAIRLRLGAPVFFRQERPGKNGEPFEMVKFRTMLDLCDAEGRPMPDDQRMTG